MRSQEILPPASILEKIKKFDPALAEKVLPRAEQIADARRRNETLMLSRRFRWALLGASALFAPAPLSPRKDTLSEAWRMTGNDIRQSMREIVETHHIPLTTREHEALRPA